MGGTVVQVIIHFVGLVAFITQSSIQSAMLYSRPAYSGGVALPAVTNRAVAILPSVPQPGPVEAHSAFIAFRGSDYVAAESSGWNVIDLNRDGLKYVELHNQNGSAEVITFETSARNDRVQWDKGQNQLPRIRDILGGGSHSLAAKYTDPYPGAEAVVMMPQGTLKACVAGTTGTDQRVDTQATLNTNGKFVIRSGAKKLTLTITPGSVVTIANVPPSWRDSLTASGVRSAPHYNVYCGMAADTQHPCYKPTVSPLLEQCFIGTGSFMMLSPRGHQHNSSASLQQSTARQAASGAHNGTATTSFECSNTQWP